MVQKVRRLLPEKLEIAKKKFVYLLDRGVFVWSKSQWACRPCCDFKLLNSKTIHDSYPIRHIQDFMNKLNGKTILFVRRGVVITPFGLFEFRYMTSGLYNASSTIISTFYRHLAILSVYRISRIWMMF